MPEITRHEAGSFCWIDLATTDVDGARAFYAGLFDWTSEDVPAGEGSTYTLFKRRGLDVAGLSLLDQARRDQGVPPHWFTYVATPSAAESAEKAGKAGGTPVMDAMDVMDAGRMAVLQDPAGALLGVWEAKNHIGARLVNEPGSLVWTELMTHDPAKAEPFYHALFGWTSRKMDMGGPDPYTMFQNGERPAAGMMKITADMGPMPSNWMVYFQAADCVGTAKQVTERGGNILVPPSDAPGVGRFSVAQDPQGAVFAFIKMNR